MFRLVSPSTTHSEATAPWFDKELEKSCTLAAANEANTFVNAVYASSVVRMLCKKPAAGLSSAALRRLYL